MTLLCLLRAPRHRLQVCAHHTEKGGEEKSQGSSGWNGHFRVPRSCGIELKYIYRSFSSLHCRDTIAESYHLKLLVSVHPREVLTPALPPASNRHITPIKRTASQRQMLFNESFTASFSLLAQQALQHLLGGFTPHNSPVIVITHLIRRPPVR